MGPARRVRCGLPPALLCASLAGCAQGRPIAAGAEPETDSAWLATVGFPLREGDALLHLDRAEIGAQRADSVAELLRLEPRVEIRLRADGRKEYRLHRTADWAANPRQTRFCELDFYLNGQLVRQRMDDIRWLQPDRMMAPWDLAALEVFALEEAPVTPPGACGAILLWAPRLRDHDEPPFTGFVTGRIVRVPGGEGIAGVEVRAEPGGHVRRTDARGRFDFGALPAARYRIDAVLPGGGSYRTELGVRSNGEAEVVVEVEAR